MVTVGTSRKSVRPRMSFSATEVPSRTASAIASLECVSEMPYLRMMISVSTPGALMSPSTSVTLPIAPRLAVGQRVSSTITISPGEAPPSCPGGTNTSIRTRRSNGATWPMPVSSRS